MRKYLHIACFSITLIAISFLKTYGQVLNDVQGSFNKYNSNAVQERIFVHTDKSAYTTGEIIWLKVYNVDDDNKPMDLSKVVYIDVLDNNQNPVLQAKIAMKNGTGTGSIYIPVTLSSGSYLFRAYTNWMKNFSPDFYFHKKITIINPLKSPDKDVKELLPAYDIQFFPEGGDLVYGLTSTIGFKATDEYGKGTNISGFVSDNSNDTISKFSSLKFGMGHFTFKPENGKSYKAIININGKTIQKDLPPVKDNGFVMSVKNEGKQLSITVATNLPAESIYLFVHKRDRLAAIETAVTDNGTAHFYIDKTKLGDGISHFTIFNSKKQPVCERLYFTRPASQLLISAAADQQQYNRRKKVNIVLDARNENNNPVVADLSLSVYRIDSLQHAEHGDIRGYLWLSSDLRGIIESPEYYFEHTDSEADEAIDNLMLTQGWSRFNWEGIINNNKPVFSFLPEYNGPIITGKITSTTTNTAPASSIITYLAIPGKRVQLYTSASDSLGHLLFNMKNFYGPGEIVVQTNTLIDTNYHIDISSPFSEQYAKIKLPKLQLTPDMQSIIEGNNINVQVQNMYNSEKIRQFYDPHVDSNGFYGTPYKTYRLDNYTRFLTIEEVMREYVSEVNIIHTKGRFHIKVITPNGFLHEDDPLVMIDGVPMFDINKIFAMDPLKIYKLDDVPLTYYWGPSTEEGIFSFISYKGDLAGVEIDPHAVVMDYDGLELQREFYSPVYDSEKAINSRIPDYRNVLYWEPYVTTDTKDKTNIGFYTSDQTGEYIGVIQGITADGRAGSQYFMFNVNK